MRRAVSCQECELIHKDVLDGKDRRLFGVKDMTQRDKFRDGEPSQACRVLSKDAADGLRDVRF